MKIKKLELHNIASIEDAVIDFDQKPLSDTDLFLITGTTGAGKTTILDGISLALYNTTPRLDKGSSSKEGASKDNLTGEDPRNLLRQNTGYGYSKLLFIGNDGKEYLAEWSVERGKKQLASSNLDTVVWTITETAGGKTLSADSSKKYGEIMDLVKKVVGLDFNQFCRTTMLAQGEFTEFLKSNEKEKAAILEKISGSDIYRKIGKAIYEQYTQADNQFKKEQLKHDQITVLPDEERKAKEKELQDISVLLPELQKQVEVLDSEIAWLNNEEASCNKVKKAEENLEGARRAVTADEFITREKLVQQWKETIDVRSARRNALDAISKAKAAERSLAALEGSFREALEGEAYLNGLQNSLKDTVQELETLIREQQDNVHAYENSQAIIVYINNLAQARRDLQAKIAARQKCEDIDIPEAANALKAAKQKRSEAQERFNETDNALKQVVAALEELNLNGLRDKKVFLTEIRSMKEDIQFKSAQLESDKEGIAGHEEELKNLEDTAEKESVEKERLSLEHERRKETIDEFAKVMRSKLNAHLGEENNTCPVCGQHVSAMRSDAVLDQEYEKIRKEFEEQKTKADSAARAVADKKSLIVQANRNLEAAGKRLSECKSRLLEKVSTHTDGQTLVNASAEDITVMLSSLSEQIAKGVEIEDEKNRLQESYTERLNAKSAAEKQCISDETALTSAQNALQNLVSEIEGKNASITELTRIISESLTGSSGWENDWMQAHEAFANELKKKTGEYNTHLSDYSKTQEIINANAPVLENISAIKAEVMKAMPNWNADNVAPARKDMVQTLWMRLNTSISTQMQALRSANDDHDRFASEVGTFLAENSGYSAEVLDTLDSISSEVHNKEAERINEMRNNVNTCASQLVIAGNERKEHLAKKPEGLKEEDTAETLSGLKSEIEGRRDMLNERKGALATDIKNDDEALKKRGDTTLLDALRAKKQKWYEFNSIYGDATGSTLSKIAQSYVLGSLLNAANVHLQNMAPRYRLLVTPGTLNLKLEDKYNGFDTRSTNTISGGESFLVSLALALALADFGQHLGVSTLFIDEGFGTLSGEALQSAVNTLKALHSNAGRQVGIISHREEIRENIPVQIKVNASKGSSASTIEVIDRILQPDK